MSDSREAATVDVGYVGIGHELYRVHISNEGDFAGDEPKKYGFVSFTRLTITIAKGLSLSRARATLMHELAHIWAWHLGLFETTKTVSADEGIANHIAEMLLMSGAYKEFIETFLDKYLAFQRP